MGPMQEVTYSQDDYSRLELLLLFFFLDHGHEIVGSRLATLLLGRSHLGASGTKTLETYYTG